MKLLLLAAVVCAVSATRPNIEELQANLTALWQQVREMRHSGACRPEVRISLDAHGGRGGRAGRGPPSSEEDDEPDMEEGEEGHGGHSHGRGHHNNDVHVHLHSEGGQCYSSGQVLHRNPWLPPHMNHLHTHARCMMMGQVQGNIEMRQEVGGSPLEVDFHLTGFPAGMAEHPHALRVHWSSVSDDTCSTMGRVFQPPHPGKGGMGNPHDQEEHDRFHPARDDSHVDHTTGEESRGPPPGGRDHVEGNLDTVSCDAEGNLEGHHEFRWVSLIGMHSIAGRSMAIYDGADHEDSNPIGCCNVNFVNGEYWGEADEWAPRSPPNGVGRPGGRRGF